MRASIIPPSTPRDPDRPSAEPVQLGHELLVHQPGQHGDRNLQARLVGNPPARV